MIKLRLGNNFKNSRIVIFGCSVVSNSSVTPMSVVCQPPVSMGFPRQEYWSGLPFPTPGDLPNPGSEPAFPVSAALQVGSLPTEPLGKPKSKC